VQLCQVLDLVGRVCRRGRILRLALLVVGRRLVVGLLLLSGPRRRVVSHRRSARRPDNERSPPYPSPETHGELLPVHPADLRLSAQGASIVASPVTRTIRILSRVRSIPYASGARL
jgi:hypothetical protein